MNRLFSLSIGMALLFRFETVAQTKGQLIDGANDPFCSICLKLINDKPKEVLFGVDINESGEVFFTMNNEDWFKKIFGPGMGITADIVLKTGINAPTLTKTQDYSGDMFCRFCEGRNSKTG